MHHPKIICLYGQHRTYNSGLFHLLISQSHLFHQINPRLFKPPDIIGVMDDSHLIGLIIMYFTLIAFSFFHVYLLPFSCPVRILPRSCSLRHTLKHCSVLQKKSLTANIAVRDEFSYKISRFHPACTGCIFSTRTTSLR